MAEPEELDAVVAACERLGLGRDSHGMVRRMLDTPRRNWPMCCGSDCHPCNLTLRRAATHALERLGREPPA